ncbi:hypothetical protein Glove_166g221 [Diversispora epigaea]|uniref:Uncharacterized protein n=1 Tax=Diversispora epigaea TaxID=1348612 RepID=A0A397IZL6_9GLOM|nr:hypothetical protein Glove_166g221 [Diversispora epigaea]
MSQIKAEPISLEDKEVNDFVDLKHKEQVSKEIIQSIKEKKLREQDLSLVNHNDWELMEQLSASSIRKDTVVAITLSRDVEDNER